jgi:hypothetical protein
LENPSNGLRRESWRSGIMVHLGRFHAEMA